MKRTDRPGGEEVLGAHRAAFTVWEPTDTVADVLCAHYTVAPGDWLEMHHHDELTEAWFVVEGRAQLNVGDNRFELQAPGAVVLPKGIPHSLLALGEKTVRIAAFVTPRPVPGLGDVHREPTP